MTLEDHAGDIVRKARVMSSVDAEAAARAAGCSVEDLAAFESGGTATRPLDLKSVASLMGLNGDKLLGVFHGWVPLAPDLSQWRELRRITTCDDGMDVHCYLVWDEVTREAAVFDTGVDAQPVFTLIQENELQLKHVFITHGHYDHVQGLEAIQRQFPRALLHTGARDALPQHRNRPNDFIHLGSLRVTNRDTPGHAEDGVTYIMGNWPEDAPNVAVVGDALFAGSMGKAANGELARAKVQQQILTLPSDTLICPGHGPLTTVGQERDHNPFF
jgi:glyoxylase-like metal-dependent hydrolase (beta-lactamase superfamily II)